MSWAEDNELQASKVLTSAAIWLVGGLSLWISHKNSAG